MILLARHGHALRACRSEQESSDCSICRGISQDIECVGPGSRLQSNALQKQHLQFIELPNLEDGCS